MKIVVDTNILFSFFWKNSLTKKLILNSSLELYSPIYVIEEILKYKSEIIKKTNIKKSMHHHDLKVVVWKGARFLDAQSVDHILKNVVLGKHFDIKFQKWGS